MIALDVRPVLSPAHVPMAWLKVIDHELMQPSSCTDEPSQSDEVCRRSVHFNLVDNECLDYFQPLSDNERQAVWYSGNELAYFFKSQRKVAEQARRKTSLREEDTRGLEEYLSIRAGLDAKARRVSVWQAVFEEQYRQRKQGVDDPLRISKKAKAASKLSRERALDRGHQDAEDVLPQPGKELRHVEEPGVEIINAEERLVLDRESHVFMMDAANAAPRHAALVRQEPSTQLCRDILSSL